MTCMLVRDVRLPKAIRKGIAHETKRRSDKKLGRVFVDLGGRKDVASVGGKHYPMIVKDDFTRRAWMYFLRSKSDAGSAFQSLLASVRADGIPSLVEIVRSDNGGEFFGGEFASVCNELLIKQEFTPAYSPCLLYTSPSPRDQRGSRMPSSA